MKKLRRTTEIILGILLSLCLAFFIYCEVYYHAKDVDSCMESSDTVVVSETNSYIEFEGAGTDYDVLIIYPGAKVEAKAYAPLARSIAEEGHHVYIVRFLLRFAFFGENAADKIMKKETTDSYTPKFYLAGHSLGGAMGAYYAYKRQDVLSGMIYLASFSTKDFSNSSLKALSIYGSEDKVLNQKQYSSCLKNMPSDFTEVIIEGGCHAYFASYGAQKGDGTPTITREAQTEATRNAILSFMTD